MRGDGGAYNCLADAATWPNHALPEKGNRKVKFHSRLLRYAPHPPQASHHEGTHPCSQPFSPPFPLP